MSAKPDPYARGLAYQAADLHAEAIACFEAVLAEDPRDLRALFALGNTAAALGMAKPAEAFFREVLALEPARLEAIVQLANLLRAQGQLEAAEALLAPALARDPEAPELWLTLGSVHREKGDPERAAAHYREALARAPDMAAALGNLADILADDGDTKGALALYGRVLAREPDNAQARLNRAIVHFLRGELEEGWDDYAARLAITGKAPVPDRRLPRWMGGALARTRLLVTAEQGVGDQIMFASLLPELAARAGHEDGSIILECEPRLVPLFARSFPGVTVRPSKIEKRGGVTLARYDWLTAEGGADAAIEIGSLPGLMRRRIADFPSTDRYLVPDAAETANWRQTFASAGRAPRIGICWRSGARGGGRAVQYAPLAAWADFLRQLPGTLVSAQYDADREELFELEKLSGRKIVVPAGLDQKNELDRSCAMLRALDCVVSAPTAVSWLAGGAGVPTLKMLYDTSWTSFGQPSEPFAPACRLMMPKRRGDWADAFQQAARRINAGIAPS